MKLVLLFLLYYFERDDQGALVRIEVNTLPLYINDQIEVDFLL
jgi:hypothetical protein